MTRNPAPTRTSAHRKMRLDALESILSAMAEGARTRRDIQRLSGLSWGATSQGTSQLLAFGFLSKRPLTWTVPPDGRRPGGLEAASDQGLTAAVEWRAPAATLVVVDLAGRVVRRDEWLLPPPAAMDGAACLQRVAEWLARLRADHGPGAVRRLHLVFTGAVDGERRIWRRAPQWPGVCDTDFTNLAREHPDVELAVEHDATAWAREAARGVPGASERGYVCFNFNEGVGLAVYENGRFLRGHRGMAGEIGHLPGTGRARCACGRIGCVETEFLPASVRRRASLRRAAADGDSFWETLAPAERRRAMDYWSERFLSLLLTAVDLFDPPLILAGGGPLPWLEKELSAAWPAFIHARGWAHPEVKLSFYRPRPGMAAEGSARGGAALLRRRCLEERL